MSQNLSDYFYELPDEAIAQVPLAKRQDAKLLVDRGEDLEPYHLQVKDLSSLLRQGDVVVVNDARVLNARLKLRKATGGEMEVLLLRPLDDSPDDDLPDSSTWEALIRPSKRVPPGTQLFSASGELLLEAGSRLADGKREVITVGTPIEDVMHRAGEVPLPPYIHSKLQDPQRYQSVFAHEPTAAAAPTAGLHLTEKLIAELQAKGVQIHKLNLAIGLDTFRPITEADITAHRIHSERYEIPLATWQACQEAKQAGQRVVAIGTTVVRSLETAHISGELSGESKLYITPGHNFGVIDALMTNFHLPHSSLLVLLAAFIGPRWQELYEVALQHGYRFLSFGDAMFCEKDLGV